MNKKNQIKIYDFTKYELQMFLDRANFTEDEERLFNLRAKYYTLEQVAEEMNISSKTAYRINKKVKNKIIKVCMEMYNNF